MQLDLCGYTPLPDPGIDTVAGVSGGRTSAMMAALLPDSTRLSFQNTGLEHPKTYEFLTRLEDALQRPITWLEWRPPEKYGDPPRMFRFEVVTRQTATYGGELFVGFLRALATYRRLHKEANPVAPWARSRICTAYLKHRIQDAWIQSCGWDAYDSYVGLRADEPSRVAGLKARETQIRGFRMPLSDSGVIKSDVLRFWSQQSFDLEIADYQGNCTGCFLKDQADLSRLMHEPETKAEVWYQLAEEFPDFGGQNFRGYRALADELPMREKFAEFLRAGVEPVQPVGMERRRFLRVVRQERDRLDGAAPGFSCSCETSIAG
jgi:3'-phosphoadenosine 5'-phosphosulfate sulfotransferase (PAPS reductase)/FAD synthetase